MINVDPGFVNAPESATSQILMQEYTVRAEEIMIQSYKPGAAHGMTRNTGNIYVLRKAVQGSGNRDDTGAIVGVLEPGQTFFVDASAMNRNVWNPYRYYIDADNANEGALVTLTIQ
jgi:hypothetical protein